MHIQLVDNAILATLAILKANWDSDQKSYLDNFLPFLLDVVKTSNSKQIEARTACELVSETYGIKIPEAVMNSLLRRAVSRGFGRREQGLFIADPLKIEANAPLSSERAKVLRKQSALANRLVAFSRENYGVLLSKSDAENAILEHVEKHAVPLLGSIVAGSKYAGANESLESGDVRFVVNAFVVNIVDSDPESFEYLEALVKGSMLAATLYLPKASEAGRKFNKTTIFLDTPLVLRALGYEGPDAQQAALDIIELCRKNNAYLACFAHTVKEVRGVLLAAAETIGRAPRGTTRTRGVGMYFFRESITPSEVMLFADKLEDDLLELKVTVMDKPQITSELAVDEEALRARLESSISYTRTNGMFHDLDSLTAIHRLRLGRYTDRLEDCRAILVTSNTRLVGVSRAFFVNGGDRYWAPAISEHDLATLLWIKMPLSAPNLPRNQIVADCYSALEPGETFWQKCMEGIDRLSTDGTASERDVVILKYSGEARFALMNRTLGNPNRITQSTISDVLNDLQTDLTAPAEVARRSAETRATELKQALLTSSQRLDVEERRRIDAERVVQETSARLLVLENAHHKQRESIRFRAERSGHAVRRICYIFAITIVIGGAVFTIIPAAGNLLPANLKFVPGVLAATLIVGSAIALAFGGSIRGMSEYLDRFFSSFVEKRLLSRAGLQVADDETPRIKETAGSSSNL